MDLIVHLMDWNKQLISSLLNLNLVTTKSNQKFSRIISIHPEREWKLNKPTHQTESFQANPERLIKGWQIFGPTVVRGKKCLTVCWCFRSVLILWIHTHEMFHQLVYIPLFYYFNVFVRLHRLRYLFLLWKVAALKVFECRRKHSLIDAYFYYLFIYYYLFIFILFLCFSRKRCGLRMTFWGTWNLKGANLSERPEAKIGIMETLTSQYGTCLFIYFCLIKDILLTKSCNCHSTMVISPAEFEVN